MKIFQVDAFTDTPFQGNPAGVCLLEGPQPDAWLQGVAREMNLSETAFFLSQEGMPSLRWFTPLTEVSLCGHATLATAHILWQEQMLSENEKVQFKTRSGILTAAKKNDRIELDFPAFEVQQESEAGSVVEALQVRPLFVGRHILPNGSLYLLEIDRESDVRALSPDMEAICRTDAIVVIVTCRADDPAYDFVSRVFAPAVGITEDPVTGMAHCYLAPYWARKLGKKDLTGFQASDRTGIVGCSWQDERVLLKGKAVTVFSGDLVV